MCAYPPLRDQGLPPPPAGLPPMLGITPFGMTGKARGPLRLQALLMPFGPKPLAERSVPAGYPYRSGYVSEYEL